MGPGALGIRDANVQDPPRTAWRSRARGPLWAVILALGPAPAAAALDESRARALADLSLEDLMQVEVTTVLGTAQPRATAPAALYVITADDIRRSGHRTLAEALRLVPSMYVGRLNSSSWVIGARGLTGSAITATRYLVLIDERVVYDPLISATFWDTTDVPLADIERIEVIRGPGATLWGANAMNGVVNVITKSAHDTQGPHAVLGAGSYEQGYATLRHGGRIGSGAFRAYVKYANRDDFENAQGVSIDDAWSSLRTGFRADLPVDDATTVTLSGDVYEHPVARSSVRIPVPGQHLQFQQVAQNDDVSGAHLIARAERRHGDGARSNMHAYYDRTRRFGARFGVERDTVDLDWRHFRGWGAHALGFGLQFNRTQDHVANGPALQFDPMRRGWNTWNAFVQDTFPVGDRAEVTVGTKLTHHDFTGVDWQPSVRGSWAVGEKQNLWAAVSRPVRVPSRFEEDGLLVFSYVDTGLATGRPPSGVIVPVGVGGDDDLRVEELVAYEAGHRATLGERVQVDSVVFYHDYRRLIGAPPGIFGSFTDAGEGETYGFNVNARVQATDRWRLEGSYARTEVGIDGPIFEFEEMGTPRHMAQLHSRLDVTDTLELNASAYYVDEVPRIPVDSYTRLDVGLRWHARPDLELALVGQNLLEDMHAEASGAQVPRSWYVQVTLGGDD